ncbi:MAG TPA: DUF1501 domain-containing protein [Desulfuromonadales bacterium]|nr:DUF1501 domain-containing protein [Desulfuromonadales bacterium]
MSYYDLSRREFLRRSALLGLTAAAAPLALKLAAIGEAAAAQSPDDYKALVCVFLYGGNDNGNTLIPYDAANYSAYAQIRQNLALTRDSLAATVLTPIVPLPDSSRQMALAPQLAPLKTLFDSGNLAVLLNIGTLVQPTTLTQYKNANVPLPPKLFSHNDQQSFWQSSLPEGATSGWGGRIGDLLLSGNASSTFTCINISGNAVYMSGRNAVQYQVGTGGAVALRGISSPLYGSQACSNALQKLVTETRTNLLEDAHSGIMKRALSANTQVLTALKGVSLTTSYDQTNSLSLQLQMVARLIAARNSLGSKRQVFFVSLGGFDTHDNLATLHPPLLTALGSALSSFYASTVELGVADKVTTFTASDFGRTLSSNGGGSDHGWGSHHFVLGGAVKGGRFFGTLPVTAINGPDDVGQGRLLPSTSVDQLAATLATWSGVAVNDLSLVMPNIVNFSVRDLGLFG